MSHPFKSLLFFDHFKTSLSRTDPKSNEDTQTHVFFHLWPAHNTHNFYTSSTQQWPSLPPFPFPPLSLSPFPPLSLSPSYSLIKISAIVLVDNLNRTYLTFIAPNQYQADQLINSINLFSITNNFTFYSLFIIHYLWSLFYIFRIVIICLIIENLFMNKIFCIVEVSTCILIREHGILRGIAKLMKLMKIFVLVSIASKIDCETNVRLGYYEASLYVSYHGLNLCHSFHSFPSYSSD